MAKKYRVGIIGSTGRGNYGHALDEAFVGIENCENVAVADDNAGGRANTANKLKVEQTFADYRKMMDKVKPDIVVIGPRWLDQHRDMAVAAAERGIHIYMEKPFCRNLEEADQIVDACERTHTKLAIAHPTRYSPKLNRVKRLIEAGRFGKVLEYRMRGKEDGRGGGEDLWVLGSHIVDEVRELAGHPKWCFAQVEEGGEPASKKHVKEGAEGIGPLAGDSIRAMYGMPDGSTAYFGSVRNTAGRPSRFGLQIYCSHGLIEILTGTMPSVKCLRDRGWSPARSGQKWLDVSSKGWDQPEDLKGPLYESSHTLAVTDLITAIEKGREPKSGMYEARGSVEMIAAVFESHRQGRPIQLPLKNRKNPLTMLTK